MAIEPVKIPQNVYVEDRIIGPVTLKQIMIVMGASGLSYTIWAIMRQSGLTSGTHTFLAWTPTFIGAAFAFVKINGISLFRILLLMIERLDKPARRVWTPRNGIYVNIVTTKAPTTNAQTAARSKKTQQESQIEELSKLLDQGPPEESEQTELEVGQMVAQQPTESPKPVKPDRIQADRRKRPMDDIRETPDENPPRPGGLMRDITPPPSHA